MKFTIAKIVPLTALVTALVAPASADAAFTVTLSQVGNDVLASGTGSLNLTGLRDLGVTGTFGPTITASVGDLRIGAVDSERAFAAFFTPNTGFGTGGSSRSSTIGTGYHVGLIAGANINTLFISNGYVSGTQFTSTATFAGTTFASLGLTAGTYTYAYSATQGGPTLDRFIIQVGPAAAVPEPSSGLLCMIAGAAGVAVRSARRRRTR